jgi:hypothetical protein
MDTQVTAIIVIVLLVIFVILGFAVNIYSRRRKKEESNGIIVQSPSESGDNFIKPAANTTLEGIMKCSDCRLWRTEQCRNNPDGKDLDHAETFVCFDLKEGYVPPPTDMQVDDMDYEDEARKARNRALQSLCMGLGLVIISAFVFFGAGAVWYSGPDSSMGAIIAVLVFGGIVGFVAICVLLAALSFLIQYAELKMRSKDATYKETLEDENADEPKYPGS